jgi:3-dehydroshikimate dehydratase
MITIACCWVFGPETTPEDGLARLHASGFAAVELWPEALARFGAARWGRALRAAGMTCAQICPYFDVVRGNHVRTASLAQLAGAIAACESTGCRRLRVFTGPPWGDEVVGPAQATSAQWDEAGQALRHLCGLAALHGIEMCLECHGGSLMESSPSTRRLLDLVDCPNLTVNLQFPLEGETWSTSVAQLGRHTTHLHMHDWEGSIGDGPLTFLGAGCFPWEEALRTLIPLTGDLTCSIEHLDHGGRHDPWETVERDGPWLNALRGRLHATGT